MNSTFEKVNGQVLSQILTLRQQGSSTEEAVQSVMRNLTREDVFVLLEPLMDEVLEELDAERGTS